MEQDGLSANWIWLREKTILDNLVTNVIQKDNDWEEVFTNKIRLPYKTSVMTHAN